MMREMATKTVVDIDYSKYNFRDEVEYQFKAKKGLSRELVEQISRMKGEPDWMHNFRLRAYEHFMKRPMPTWGSPGLANINFDNIIYYALPTEKNSRSWDDVPEYIKRTFDKLGIPEAEQKFLGGVGAQYESEVVYHSLRADLEKKGVIFLGTDQGLKEHPDIFKKYFGTVIPPEDNKFAALNSAVWSGGCLTAGARVFTANPGLKSIADIREGDTVFSLSREGKLVPGKVVAHIYNGKKPVYRVRAAGQTLEATRNHMFLALDKSPTCLDRFGRKWLPTWKPLEDLRVGDIVAVAKRIPAPGRSKTLPQLPTYRKNSHLRRSLRSPEATDADLTWLLGLWVGDGNTYAPNEDMRFINFALPESDPVRLEAIQVIQRLFNYTVKTQTRDSFTVNSKAIGEWLKELGLVGKAKTKRIPDWIYGLSMAERLAFLGGLLDADGWVDSNGKTVAFELANPHLVEDIKLLAISCGLFSGGKIRERDRHSVFQKRGKAHTVFGTAYACRITGNVKRIGSRSPRRRALLEHAVKRTHDKYNVVTGENFSSLTTQDLGFAPIRDIEYVGTRDVYDIQVEGYANFVANGIVAHNSFIYVPPGVNVEAPLQAYFRINAENIGQFERTLIIADKGSRVHYIEGCTAPIYTTDSLHSAVVEIIAMPGAYVRYTTIQNWSSDVYNLVTKRAHAHENATVEWVDGNIGSKVTMKYPSVYLLGKGAKAEILSIAFAGKGQHQDAGGKVVHLAPHTTSRITSKSVSKDGGRSTYRGLLHVAKGAKGVKSSVRCDALLLDEYSKTDTYPYNEINEEDATITHEATVGKIGEDQLFYLMSRGLSEQEALNMIVMGFIEPFTKELPMEYAVELNRLIQLEMAGSVG